MKQLRRPLVAFIAWTCVSLNAIAQTGYSQQHTYSSANQGQSQEQSQNGAARFHDVFGADRIPSNNAEYKRLVFVLIAQAKRQLEQGGEFLPFAAAITEGGKLVRSGQSSGSEHTLSDEVIESLVGDLRRGAASGSFRATGICTSVTAVRQSGSTNTNAIRCCLDHKYDGPLQIILPFEREPDRIRYGSLKSLGKYRENLVFNKMSN